MKDDDLDIQNEQQLRSLFAEQFPPTPTAPADEYERIFAAARSLAPRAWLLPALGIAAGLGLFLLMQPLQHIPADGLVEMQSLVEDSTSEEESDESAIGQEWLDLAEAIEQVSELGARDRGELENRLSQEASHHVG